MGWFSKKHPPDQAQAQAQASSAPKGPQPGEVWKGLTTYTTDPHIGRPGYYALDEVRVTEDGGNIHQILEPQVMLTWVDDDPTDEENLGGHFVVADPDEPYFSHLPASINPNVISFETHARGTSNVGVE